MCTASPEPVIVAFTSAASSIFSCHSNKKHLFVEAFGVVVANTAALNTEF
jgi:hypothetical protein